MSDYAYVPWNDEQVIALIRWQFNDEVHPFTCGMHDEITGHVRLVPTTDGWRCPVDCCSWRQDWAHDFMADVSKHPKPRNIRSRLVSSWGRTTMSETLYRIERDDGTPDPTAVAFDADGNYMGVLVPVESGRLVDRDQIDPPTVIVTGVQRIPDWPELRGFDITATTVGPVGNDDLYLNKRYLLVPVSEGGDE